MKKMKKIIYLILVTAFLGCSKNEDNLTPTTTVQYQIIPMNNYFTQFKFIDNTGSLVTITDPTQFTNGTKSISITKKPFSAKFETNINNTTSESIKFSLAILVDGQIKKIIDVNAPAMATYENSIEFIVQ